MQNDGKRTLVANDAFSSGQVGSKLWLCDELGKILSAGERDGDRKVVWIYGGWQGVLGFLLLSRTEFKDAKVRSFDIDPKCADVANTICENWVWREWQFRAFTKDCNDLDPSVEGEFGPPPSIVINTSVEHFAGRSWFDKIPAGTWVALQASDFEHDGASSLFQSADQLYETFPIEKVLFKGKLSFQYADWGFNRHMLIGTK